MEKVGLFVKREKILIINQTKQNKTNKDLKSLIFDKCSSRRRVAPNLFI